MPAISSEYYELLWRATREGECFEGDLLGRLGVSCDYVKLACSKYFGRESYEGLDLGRRYACNALVAAALLAAQLILVAATSLVEPGQCWQAGRLAGSLGDFVGLVRRDVVGEAREYGIGPDEVSHVLWLLDTVEGLARSVRSRCEGPHRELHVAGGDKSF